MTEHNKYYYEYNRNLSNEKKTKEYLTIMWVNIINTKQEKW